jgi:uncharacterized protein YcnI
VIRHHALARAPRAAALALAGLLAIPAIALGHARVSPAVSVSGQLQLYSLAVPTEKSGATTKVVMTVPSGFGIDSFVPPPAGWRQQVQSTGAGEDAIVQKVTWSGGTTPTGEDSLFQFLAQPATARDYTFRVQQTYSDGSIVDWSGSESSEAPAPTIQVKDSLGGAGGTSMLTIIALVVGVLGLAAGALALVYRGPGGDGDGGGRSLA